MLQPRPILRLQLSLNKQPLSLGCSLIKLHPTEKAKTTPLRREGSPGTGLPYGQYTSTASKTLLLLVLFSCLYKTHLRANSDIVAMNNNNRHPTHTLNLLSQQASDAPTYKAVQVSSLVAS